MLEIAKNIFVEQVWVELKINNQTADLTDLNSFFFNSMSIFYGR